MKTILFSAVFIFLISFTTKCSKSESFQQTPLIPAADESQDSMYRFLALGDSYTIGQSVEPAERFPAQLKNTLQINGTQISNPLYIAATGWTTTSLANAVAAAQLPHNFKVVTLLIGVNDQFQLQDTVGYRQRFYNLLETAINLAADKHDHVFVLSIPDYSVTPFAASYDTALIRKQIDWFNDINKSVTIEANCNYIYITDSSRLAATDHSLITYDGLHPSGKEYKVWANLLAPLIKRVLL